MRGHGYAMRCEECDEEPLWSIERRGDVATTWACGVHLSDACERLQRDWEVTQLVIRLFNKSIEWSQMTAALEAIAREKS